MDLIRKHRLADGRTVAIRPIQSSDYAQEQAFLSNLSPDSRYLRFHKWVSAPSDKLIHFLTDIDHDQHVAFVCTSAQGAMDEIVGEGRYITEPGDMRCEFGIVIADDWHKSGIAGLLMDTLIGSARARGLKEMEGTVLRTNSSMLRFSRALGFEVIHDPDARDTVRILKRL